MGRPPCCDKANVKKGPWTPEEDAKLLAYTSTHGTGNWTNVPQRAGDPCVVLCTCCHSDHINICVSFLFAWLMTKASRGGA